jgi:hypothetical protein
LRVRGKLIRRSSKTTRLTVAKLRLADLDNSEPQKAGHQTTTTNGIMTFEHALAIYRLHPQCSLRQWPHPSGWQPLAAARKPVLARHIELLAVWATLRLTGI